MTNWKPKYLPDQFADHVKASAYRVVRNGINVTPENAPVVEVDELPWPSSNDNPDADTNEDTLPSEALTSNTDCTRGGIGNREQDQTFGKKICITSTFTYTGLDKCTAFTRLYSWTILNHGWRTKHQDDRYQRRCDGWCHVEVTHLV
jgi:hypothetical protein